MSTNKTEHYQLNQWVKSDQVVMADFNADNSKIDSALKSASDTAEAAKSKAEAVEKSAFSLSNSPYVVGTYTGDGSAKRKIELGFTPKAVLLIRSTGHIVISSNPNQLYGGGLAVTGHNVAQDIQGETQWLDGNTILAITDGGFLVGCSYKGYLYVYSNIQDQSYHYIAFR